MSAFWRVSHKATLRILAAALSGAPVATYRTRWAQDECALSLLELRAGKDPFLRPLERYSPPGARSRRDHAGSKIVTGEAQIARRSKRNAHSSFAGARCVGHRELSPLPGGRERVHDGAAVLARLGSRHRS